MSLYEDRKPVQTAAQQALTQLEAALINLWPHLEFTEKQEWIPLLEKYCKESELIKEFKNRYC